MTTSIICTKGVSFIYIYLDVYFIYNFLLDFIVLIITKKVLAVETKVHKIIAGAMLGATYAVINLVVNFNFFIKTIMTYLIVVTIMVVIAFGKATVNVCLRRVTATYVITFLLNGIINVIPVKYTAKNTILMAVVLAISVGMMFNFTLKSIKQEQLIFDVEIYNGEKEIKIRALKDTGNNLFEPVTNKPVSVVEEKVVKDFITNNQKVLYIPFKSVGKTGLMNAYVFEKMTVNHQIYTNVIIGIYKGKISSNYSMILHPDLLKIGGKQSDKCSRQRENVHKKDSNVKRTALFKRRGNILHWWK